MPGLRRALRRAVLGAAVGCVLLACEGPPRSPAAHATREGEAELAVGRPANAVVHFERALADAPSSQAARRGLALAYLALGRPAASRVQFETLAAQNEGAIPPDLLRSACRSLSLDVEAALAAEAYADAVALAQTGPLASLCQGGRLSVLVTSARRAEAARLALGPASIEALALFARVLEEEPGDPLATLGSVSLLVRAGRRAEALEILSAALARHPRSDPLIAAGVDLLTQP